LGRGIRRPDPQRPGVGINRARPLRPQAGQDARATPTRRTPRACSARGRGDLPRKKQTRRSEPRRRRTRRRRRRAPVGRTADPEGL